MAVGGGGSYKGNNRGKSYGVMLILAFGAALLGVMVIHKLRERRICHLLIKDKDAQLISLHLLLQKERDHTKEMKRKAEEMKAKLYSLRNQKMETERRILEMQSTIDSLKDEMQIMESALEEKQNAITMHSDKDNPQIKTLMESLKQKEAEIKDLKYHLENPIKIWTVRTDDPSNTRLSSNVTRNSADGEKTKGEQQMHGSTNYSSGLNSTRGNESHNASTTLIKGENTARVDEYRHENKVTVVDRLELPREGQVKKQENSFEGLRNYGIVGKETTDNGEGHEIKDFQERGALGSGKENKIANTTDKIISTVEKVSQTSNAGMRSADREEYKGDRDGQLEINNSQQEKRQDQENFKGGVQLAMQDGKRSSSSRVKDKHAEVKRWRILARNRRLESNRKYGNNGAEGMRKRKIPRDGQDEVGNKEEAAAANKGTYSENAASVNNPTEVTKAQDVASAKLLEPQNPENAVDLNNRPVLDYANHLGKFYRLSQASLELTNGSFDNNTNNIRSKAEKERLSEVEQYEGQDTTKNRNIQISGEQANAASNNDRPEETEAVDMDNETDSGTIDSYRESVPDLEEDKEEYNDQTGDEPEF